MHRYRREPSAVAFNGRPVQCNVGFRCIDGTTRAEIGLIFHHSHATIFAKYYVTKMLNLSTLCIKCATAICFVTFKTAVVNNSIPSTDTAAVASCCIVYQLNII